MNEPKPKQNLFRNSAVISAAIRAIVGSQGPGIPSARVDPPRGGFYQPPPALALENTPECVVPRSIQNAIVERAGEKLTDLELFGVPPGHEHEPAPKKFNIIGRCCYVREADLPKLKEALERQRAKQTVAATQAERTSPSCCRKYPCEHPGVGPCDMPANGSTE